MLEHVVTSHSRWPESTALHSLNINNREARSEAFMPLTPGRDVADVDVEGPGTAEGAEVAEAAGAAEDEVTIITVHMSLMALM